MNSKYAGAFLAIAAFIIVAGYDVKAQRIELKGNIPFDFFVGDYPMKSGEYKISRFNMVETILKVVGNETEQSVLRPVMVIEQATIPKQTILVFKSYVDTNGETSTFLSQIRIEGEKTGRQFVRSRAENDARARAAKRDIITLVISRRDQ